MWVVLCFVLAAAWLVTGASFATEGQETGAPGEEMIIKGEKKSARFSHPVHMDLGVTCGQCHHDSEHKPLTDKDIAAMESSEKLRCASCHNEEFPDPKLQSPKDAFHARCKECHKQGVNDKKGPTKCTDCHVK
jgi:hypothetical protein